MAVHVRGHRQGIVGAGRRGGRRRQRGRRAEPPADRDLRAQRDPEAIVTGDDGMSAPSPVATIVSSSAASTVTST
jgi:hypothetical protein